MRKNRANPCAKNDIPVKSTPDRLKKKEILNKLLRPIPGIFLNRMQNNVIIRMIIAETVAFAAHGDAEQDEGVLQSMQKNTNVQENGRAEPMQIDLQKVADVLLPKAWLILLAAVLGSALAFLYTHFMITPLYTANVTLYVRSTQARLDGSDSVNYNELVIAQHITDTYIAVLQSDAILDKVAAQSPVESDNAAVIRSMMSVSAVEDTSIINVRITSAYPERAEQMANLIAEHAPGPMAEYIEGSSVRILNYAKVPSAPSSPNMKQNILIGFLAGLLLSAGGVWLYALFDVRIKNEDDLSMLSDIPVLGTVPNFDGLGAERGMRKGGKK